MHSAVLQSKRCAIPRGIAGVVVLLLQQSSLVNVLAGTHQTDASHSCDIRH
jgi:hypothetical protein